MKIDEDLQRMTMLPDAYDNGNVGISCFLIDKPLEFIEQCLSFYKIFLLKPILRKILFLTPLFSLFFTIDRAFQSNVF